jgi:hypothetical protein
MELEVLKKKLSAFKGEGGRIRNDMRLYQTVCEELSTERQDP